MKEEKSKHDELCNKAIRWLYARGCQAYAQEVTTWNGIADALGIKGEDVYYIEAKASRSDLLCRKQKCVDARIQTAMGFIENPQETIRVQFYRNDVDFYYFIIADGVKFEDTLYEGWGVINESGEVIRKAKRMKKMDDTRGLMKAIAHALVYKVFGKLYLQ